MHLMLSRYKCTPWKCRKKIYSSSKNERGTVKFVYSFILALSLKIDVVPLVMVISRKQINDKDTIDLLVAKFLVWLSPMAYFEGFGQLFYFERYKDYI